jgi:hypothetical protein
MADDPSGPDPRPVRAFRPEEGAAADMSAWPATVPAVGPGLGRGFLTDPQLYFRHLFSD